MDENLHDIEHSFFNALDDNEEQPSQQVWQHVEKQLDADELDRFKTKYGRVRKFACALALLIIVIAGIEFLRTYDGVNRKAVSQSHVDDKPGEQKPVKENVSAVDDKKNDRDSLVKKSRTVKNPLKVALDIHDKPLNEERKITEEGNSTVYNKTVRRNTTHKYSVKTLQAMPEEDIAQDDIKADNQQKDKPAQQEKTKRLSLASPGLIKPVKANGDINVNYTSSIKIKYPKVPTLSRFSIMPFVSPDLAWYHLQDHDERGSSQQANAHEIEEDERHLLSSTYGLLVEYKLNHHWSLQSGVALSNTYLIVDPQTVFAEADDQGDVKYRINTSSGYGYLHNLSNTTPAVGDSMNVLSASHSLHYISIPLSIIYTITKRRFFFHSSAGISLNLLNKALLETTIEKGNDNITEPVNELIGLKKLYVGGSIGLGADYQLNRRTSFVFTPTIRFALGSITGDSPVRSYPMSFGFSAGVKLAL